jgi:hypothetical protein
LYLGIMCQSNEYPAIRTALAADDIAAP